MRMALFLERFRPFHAKILTPSLDTVTMCKLMTPHDPNSAPLRPKPHTLDGRLARPVGRPADRIIAGWAAGGLLISVVATLWFWVGFHETDPGFSASSSAFLLSALLGAFAIVPCAIIMRLGWSGWRHGFRVRYGLWALFLFLPWIGFAVIAFRSDWLPELLSVAALLIAFPIILWSVASLWLEQKSR